MRDEARSSGAALLLTLWCVAIVSVLVILTARIVDQDVETESSRARRFEARQFALSGIAYGRDPKVKRDSGLLTQKFPDGGELTVRLRSESGRANINQMLVQKDQVWLRDLFELWGVQNQDISVAVDSLLDWMDAGGLRRQHGAEEEQLRNQNRYSIPQNRAFREVEEMARVRGMDAVARAKPDWREYFTVYGGTKLDVQDAPADLLQVMGGFSSRQADALVAYRQGEDGIEGTADDRVFENLEEAIMIAGGSRNAQAGLSNSLQIGAEPTRIESEGRLGGATYRISVVTVRGVVGQDLAWEEQ